MAETVTEAAKILERFTSEDRPPVLDPDQVDLVVAYLEEEGLESSFGSLAGPQGVNRTEALLGDDGRKRLESHPGAILGPYFLSGVYSRDGIAVWAPRTELEPITAS